MLIPALLVAHVAVLGYWLGAELVINSTYRYVSFGSFMPFEERNRLMDHVMNVDQHVRYALILQFGLGFALAALYGYVPGGETSALAAGLLAALWLGFVEIVHQLRHRPVGRRLAAVDRLSRYLLMALLVGIALGLLGGQWAMPFWLRLKLALFAAVMASGVGIRFALIGHFRAWAVMKREGPSDAMNEQVRVAAVRGTSILVLLWVFIAAIVVVSVWKPA